MSALVARDAAAAQRAARRWHVPAAVLLGLEEIESGGNPHAVSPVGARGRTQFMPATARSYHVGSDADSQLAGAAHYLHDLGYSRNPRRALASYNAGPGNPGAAGNYPDKVLAAAKHYGHLPTAADAASAPQGAPGAPEGLDAPEKRAGALKALLTTVLVAAGGYLALFGLTRAVGVASPAHQAMRAAPRTAAVVAK